MKTIDLDAKHLIRNYIDSIEEYFRSNSKLHPNEIDSLLNEINDFVNLRCRELAKGDRVHYDDVLKAIDECGSPSEICDTYLDLEKGSSSEEFWEKLGIKELKDLKKTKGKQTETPLKCQDGHKRSSLRINLELVLRHYAERWPLLIYRLFSLMVIAFLYYFLLFSTLGQIYSWDFGESDAFFFDQITIIDGLEAINITFENILTFTLVAIIFVLMECYLVKNLKKKLTANHLVEIDNTIMVNIFRFGLILLVVKSSLFLVPFYIFALPVWFSFQLVVEKQFQTKLWRKHLAPYIRDLGLRFSNTSKDFGSRVKLNLLSWIKGNMSLLDIVCSTVIVFVMGWILSFPSIFFLDFLTRSSTIDYEVNLFYYTATYLAFFSVICIIGVIVISVASSTTFIRISPYMYKSNSGKKVVSALTRLTILQTFVMVNTYWNEYLGLVFRIVLLALFLLNEYLLAGASNRSYIRSKIAEFLISFSGSQEGYTVSNATQKEHKLSHDVAEEDKPLQPISEKTVMTTQKEHKLSHDVAGEDKPLQPISEKTVMTSNKSLVMTKMNRILLYLLMALMSSTKRVVGFMVPVLRAIFITIMLFVISAYEVILSYLIIMTGFTKDGLYIIPMFELELGWLMRDTTSYIIEVGPIYLWIYFAIIMVGIQAFVTALVSLSTVMFKMSEGLTIRFVRILTRVFLLALFLASLIQHFVGGDYYAQFRLLYVIFLSLFHELVALKVRYEQKKLRRSLEVISDTTTVTDQTTIA